MAPAVCSEAPVCRSPDIYMVKTGHLLCFCPLEGHFQIVVSNMGAPRRSTTEPG